MFKKTLITFAVFSNVWVTAGIAQSQPTLGATATTSTNAQDAKMAAGFAEFAGSTENAQSKVNGLRTGTSITLEPSETGPNSTAPSGNLSPATGTLGYGNVRTAISLAQASLAKQGVTNPTPSQLSAALGERAQGLGWGQIAKGMGVKLGSVVSASRTNKSTQSGLAKMDKTDNASNGLAKGKSSGNTGSAGGNSGGNGGKGGGGGNGGGKG